MSNTDRIEDLLRRLAPEVLGAVARRYRNFTDAEDATQEALLAAGTRWSSDDLPEDPLAWLIRVASRRMVDQYRRDDARRRRELLVAAQSLPRTDPVPAEDDTLLLMFMCCHPSLTPAACIPLTLRAVGGLTTRQIASAFLVSEPTMAQRISRAKTRIRESDEPFAFPPPEERSSRLRLVLHVLYLMFNEGYVASGGSLLGRSDLAGEAIRLTRTLHSLSDDPEVVGLLSLMLLTEARRPARTGPGGELVPLADQDRSRWNQDLISEGVDLLGRAFSAGAVGEYQLQAAIATVHDRASCYADTDWAEILSLYGLLERMTGNPMVNLNRAVATAMAHGPTTGLQALEGLESELGDHHRLRSVRAHLLEMAGDGAGAAAEFRAAAALATNVPERDYLTTRAARLASINSRRRPASSDARPSH